MHVQWQHSSRLTARHQASAPELWSTRRRTTTDNDADSCRPISYRHKNGPASRKGQVFAPQRMCHDLG